MAIKLFLLVAILAVTYVAGQEHEDTEANYHFQWAVDDHHTGDKKSHEESRKGHKVEGKYTVVDPDGHLRTVKYTSDKHVGFQAEVRREKVHSINEQKPTGNQHENNLIHHFVAAPIHHYIAAPITHFVPAPVHEQKNHHVKQGNYIHYTDSHATWKANL